MKQDRNEIPHALFDFMKQLQKNMSDEYDRISLRVKQDPGTAGDEGEENWASFLRNWLPAIYPVVTKGRILSCDGTASPQVDVLVLNPNYPLHLRNKKLYFSGGVIAAFECKLNLKKRHLKKIFETSKYISDLDISEGPTLYELFNSRILFGVLAHTHDWKKGKTSDVVFSILNDFMAVAYRQETLIKEFPDVFCISDTSSYTLEKEVHMSGNENQASDDVLKDLNVNVALSYGYAAHWVDQANQFEDGSVLGTLISYLTRKIAYTDPSVRAISRDYTNTGIDGTYIQNVFTHELEGLGYEFIKENYYRQGGKDNPWNGWVGKL